MDKLGDPQGKRARQSALFTLKKMRQAVHCSSTILKAKVYGTHTPCKNKHSKGQAKPLLFKNYINK